MLTVEELKAQRALSRRLGYIELKLEACSAGQAGWLQREYDALTWAMTSLGIFSREQIDFYKSKQAAGMPRPSDAGAR